MSEIQLISPVDGSIYCERMYASTSEINNALEASKKAQCVWQDVSVEQRVEFCHQALAYFRDHKSDIAAEITWQMGRPIQYAEGEINGLLERAEVMLSLAPSQLADEYQEERVGFKRYIRREPLGTVFVIAPWNYPYLTAINTIIPALAAGNAVILKHSVQTLLCAERFQKAFDYAGLPQGVFQYLHLDHPSTSTLISDPTIDFVAFTGSVEGGKSVETTAAGLFKGVGLELGGKDPTYVLDDASMDEAVEGIVDGAFFNSGQSCCGVERVYVQKPLFEEFLEKTISLVSGYQLGLPTDFNTTLGPVVSEKSAEWVRRQLQQAVDAGAKTCIDSTLFPQHQEKGNYLAPQVVVDVDHSMSIMRDESFGPVIGIMPVDSDEEAIALMNDSAFGLTASLWSSDIERAETIGKRVQTGTLFLNRCDYLDPQLPWVGIKHSGRGCTLSRLGYEQLTRPKSFHLKLP